jgi:hypothetical protein
LSPLAGRDRLAEYARKGVELGLRQVALSPELVRARRLRAQWSARSVSADGPSVVILTPRSWASHVQWEAVLGHALRLRGARVTYLTCGGGLELCDRVNVYQSPPPPCGQCTMYVERALAAHGHDHRPLLDGASQAAWPELDELEVEELSRVTWDGLPLGRLIDIPTKWFLMSTQVTQDPLGPLTMRRLLRAARPVVAGIRRAIDELAPDVMVMLNGTFFFEAIARAICEQRGVPVVSYERGFVFGSLWFSRGTPAVRYDMGDHWDKARATPLSSEQERRLDDYLEDRGAGRRQYVAYSRAGGPTVDRTTAGRRAVLFSNITWDSAVIGREVAYPSIQAWIAAAIEAFRVRPEHELVVRLHPAEVRLHGQTTREALGPFIHRRFPRVPENVTVVGADEDVSSYELMRDADLGLVLTSTVGLELALLGTPVIVAGKPHYSGRGFTNDAASAEDFIAMLEAGLADPHALVADRELARRYANAFLFDIPLAWTGVSEPILGLARLDVGSLDELAPGAAPDLDRICGLVLGDVTSGS